GPKPRERKKPMGRSSRSKQRWQQERSRNGRGGGLELDRFKLELLGRTVSRAGGLRSKSSEDSLPENISGKVIGADAGVLNEWCWQRAPARALCLWASC